jgi:hypothetical protein
LICRTEGNVILYECSLCNSLVSAYLKELRDELMQLHKKRLDRFKVNPPEWVRGVKNER